MYVLAGTDTAALTQEIAVLEAQVILLKASPLAAAALFVAERELAEAKAKLAALGVQATTGNQQSADISAELSWGLAGLALAAGFGFYKWRQGR